MEITTHTTLFASSKTPEAPPYFRPAVHVSYVGDKALIARNISVFVDVYSNLIVPLLPPFPNQPSVSPFLLWYDRDARCATIRFF